MLEYTVGDLVVLLETVEWDEIVGIKGEICIIAKVYNRTDPDDGIFFDYKVCTADGAVFDVWQGEIEKLENAKKI